MTAKQQTAAAERRWHDVPWRWRTKTLWRRGSGTNCNEPSFERATHRRAPALPAVPSDAEELLEGKDTRMISIREATPADAAAMLALKQTLDRETRFMLVEPDERTSGEEDERVHLAALNAQTNSVVLVADDAGALVGYVEASGGEFRRNHRTAYVVIGVVAGHAGSGIGSGLLAALDVWAATAGVHRLELTVMAHNQAAIGLYRKMGYQVEGTRRAALVIDAEFIDELWMAKLLDPPSVEAASRG